jgi:orotidine-5'-phosphate decarboxylase
MTATEPHPGEGSAAAGVAGPAAPDWARRAGAATSRFGPLVMGLDPSGALLREWELGDTPDGLQRFVDIVVEAAVGTVGLVKPQSAFYERHGWRGMHALTRLVAACRDAGIVVILDAKRGDVGSTNTAYAESYLGEDAPISVDALTITPYLGFDAMVPFFERAQRAGAGVLVVTRSSNPHGRDIQCARHPDGRSVEARIVERIAAANRQAAPGRLGPFGAVFGPTHGAPDDVDLPAMEGLFLAPGVGAQGASPRDVATCFATCPDRVLPSASRSLLSPGPDPLRLRDAAGQLSADLADALAGR